MRHKPANDQAEAARQIFQAALEDCTVEAAFRRAIRCDGSRLHIEGDTCDLSLDCEILIVSIGKAGASMFDALAAMLPSTPRAIVVAPTPPRTASANLTFFPGSHPEPGASSLLSARAILDAIAYSPPDTTMVFLISGGASSMCELPLSDAATLDDLIQLNRLLIGSGGSIAEINCVRKHLSRIKGGRLAVAAGARRKITLLVSDVPAAALDALGSGPTLPDTTTLADCQRILDHYNLSLPPAFQSAMEETPKPNHPAFTNATAHVLLSNDDLLHHAALAAQNLGYETLIDNTCDDWPYAEAADYLLTRLRQHATPRRQFALLSGGEVTVRLSATPGIGGRNQQFALYCAAQTLPPGVTILSAGSDGIDGNSPAAGAIADSTTSPRAAAANLDLTAHLLAFNAHPFFTALGDDIQTGLTENNLRDLRIFLWDGGH